MFTKNLRSKLLFFLIFSAIEILSLPLHDKDSLPDFEYLTIKELHEQIDKIFADTAYSSFEWAVCIQSLLTGEYLYKRNENKFIIPASNLKLFTTTASLLALKPDYRFKTEVYSYGNIDGTILKGNLVIRGFGDPTISGRFNNDDILKVFNNWADSLFEKGIDEITGNILGDDNNFDDIRLGEGWQWDYESEWYSAPSGALSFNDNCVDILVSAGNLGELASYSIKPKNGYASILNNVITVKSDSITDIRSSRQSGTNIINIYGTIKIGEKNRKLSISINNPTQYFVVTFKEVLEQRGIRVKGYATDIDDIEQTVYYNEKLKLLFTHLSPPLAEIVKFTNKNSDNFYAEQLLKILGYEYYKYGSSANGIKALRSILKDFGIETDKLFMVDGSGLSRLNLVTTSTIIALLNKVYNSDIFPYFYNSLSVAGKDGALASRMRRARAYGNIRGKAGFLTSVRSLSGYLFTGDKEFVSYSIIANNFLIPRAIIENVQDIVCTKLSNLRRK